MMSLYFSSAVLLFSIYRAKTFYPVHIIFIILVSLSIDIQFYEQRFYNTFTVNSVTNIFMNDLYITHLFDSDNVTEECNMPKSKSNMPNISITSDYNAFSTW